MRPQLLHLEKTVHDQKTQLAKPSANIEDEQRFQRSVGRIGEPIQNVAQDHACVGLRYYNRPFRVWPTLAMYPLDDFDSVTLRNAEES